MFKKECFEKRILIVEFNKKKNHKEKNKLLQKNQFIY